MLEAELQYTGNDNPGVRSIATQCDTPATREGPHSEPVARVGPGSSQRDAGT